jgi:hypothetical protein
MPLRFCAKILLEPEYEKQAHMNASFSDVDKGLYGYKCITWIRMAAPHCQSNTPARALLPSLKTPIHKSGLMLSVGDACLFLTKFQNRSMKFIFTQHPKSTARANPTTLEPEASVERW